MFSGGKRALEDRPAPIIQGRNPARDEAAVEDKAAGEVPGEVSPLVATEPGATAAVALAMVATTTVDMATAAMGTKKGKLLSQ